MFSPKELGFPSHIKEFRLAQEEAVDFALTCDSRFCAIGAPPGVGKSAIALALARLLGGRTVILTATLGLQDQYLQFKSMGLADIRGRANYACWEGGTCEDGARLDCGDKVGCPYMAAFRFQNASPIVSTSYAYWLAVHEKGNGIAAPDTLVCDEAHLADNWLSRALDFHVSERELKSAGEKPKTFGEDIAEWKGIGAALVQEAETRYHSTKNTPMEKSLKMREMRRAESFLDRAKKVNAMTADNWVCTKEEGTDDGRLWRFECVWPGMYRERLFRGVSRVLLMSATLRPKTLSLLGIGKSDYSFKEWGRQFPAINGPVIWIPTARMNHKASAEMETKWLNRHREIVSARQDRKGIIHTKSFQRAKLVGDALGNGYKRILNGSADPESQSAIESFKKHVDGPKNSILISPSFSTGWDFAGRSAEYQIISKIPIPDTRSKVMQARVEKDRDYPTYIAAQELVQASGRIVRSEKDRGETFIIDDAWEWFKRAAEPFLPKWFRVRREEKVPPPLKKIEEGEEG